MNFYKKNRNAIFIFILFLSSFIIHIFYMSSILIYGDEAVYAEIIDEFIRTPTLIPHYMGHMISWKPPFGFAVYSLLIYVLRIINPGVPTEIAYRVPSIIFGVLLTLALYFLVRKLYSEEIAFLSALIFTVNTVSVAISLSLLLDTLVLFLVISGVILYMEGERDTRYFFYAGFVGALAFLTKSIMAFLLPALAIAYYVGDRKISRDSQMGRAFLLSLSGVPIAMFLYAAFFFLQAPFGKGGDITVMYVYDFFRVYKGGFDPVLILNTIDFLKLLVPWSILFFGGLLMMKLSRREDRFIFLWLVLMLVFLGAGQFYSWYYLPILPPFSVVCSKALLQIRKSRFFLPILVLLLISSVPYIANPAFMDSYLRPSQVNAEKAQVGLFLRDKTHILSITERGLPEIVFYKFHGEKYPDYSGFEMTVLNPFAPTSYAAYETLSEIAMGVVHTRNITDAAEVRGIIANSSKNGYVVMDSKVYSVYSSSPFQNYSLAFNSSAGSFVVIRRVT
jgi:4-amino-4-deoxy-L-arabinose transferase-like glycosyltransferase